jgi:hypothetical protein
MAIKSAQQSHALDSYGNLTASLDVARQDFGLNLSRWRHLNGWTQDTAEQWAREAGFAPIQNSQWSKMERGSQPKPGPLLFRCLGIVNTKLADQDLRGIRSPKLLERIKRARPILHEDGEPWDGADFYAAFMGLLPWPVFAGLQREVSAAEADAWNRQFKQWFEQVVKASGLGPLDALQSLMAYVPVAEQNTMQQAVLGLGGFTAEQLQSLSDAAGLGPEEWMQRWSQAHGFAHRLQLDDWWRHVPR